MYAEELPDSLSPASGSSAASRSSEGSKTPSEASNSSDDEDTNAVGGKIVEDRIHQSKRGLPSYMNNMALLLVSCA